MRFILIDEILEADPGKHIRAIKHVAPDEDYFRDHFPGFPVVPGVLLTEMMAQTAGKCLEMEDAARGRSMLGRINGANFRAWVRPGDTATIVAEVRTSRPRFAIANCYVEVNGQEVASADLLFTFIPATQFAQDFRDEVVERYLAGRKLQPRANPVQVLGTRPS